MASLGHWRSPLTRPTASSALITAFAGVSAAMMAYAMVTPVYPTTFQRVPDHSSSTQSQMVVNVIVVMDAVSFAPVVCVMTPLPPSTMWMTRLRCAAKSPSARVSA